MSILKAIGKAINTVLRVYDSAGTILGSFKRPRLAFFAIAATVFVLAMLAMGNIMVGREGDLMRDFAGVLALGVGTGFLLHGARNMRHRASNLGLLLGCCGLTIFGVGIMQIIIAGASDFAKELAAIVSGGILGFFVDEEE